MKLRVGELLKEQHKSIYWLSKEIHMTQQNAAKLAKGQTSRISFVTLEQLCHAFKCDLNNLFDMDKDHQK